MSFLPPLISNFSTLAPDYDVVLSDVWGVVHNGVAAHPHACDALMRIRDKRRRGRPDHQRAAAERSCGAASSNDCMFRARPTTPSCRPATSTRSVIKQRRGQSLYHLGPERDRSIFSGLDVSFAPPESADYVVCSGLEDDESDTPEITAPCSKRCSPRKLFMVCGNPDVVVERGQRWSIAPARLPTSTRRSAERCFTPASPIGRSTTWRSPRRRAPPAARSRSGG